MTPDELDTIGRDIVGTGLALQLHLAFDWAHRRGIQRIFALGGEGALYRDLAPSFAAVAPRTTMVPLAVSRRSTRLAALKRLGPSEALIVRRRRGVPFTLGHVFEALGLGDDELMADVTRAGYGTIGRPLLDPHSDLGLQRLLDDRAFQRLVATRGAAARARLLGYLATQGFFSQRAAALVGIGWRALIQDHLVIATEEEPATPALEGYYLALQPPLASQRHEWLARKVGGVFDFRRHDEAELDMTEWTPLLHVFEWVSKRDGQQTIGYRGATDGYAPIPDPNVRRTELDGLRPALVSAARARVSEYAAQLPAASPRRFLETRREYLSMAQRFCRSALWHELRATIDETASDRSWLQRSRLGPAAALSRRTLHSLRQFRR